MTSRQAKSWKARATSQCLPGVTVEAPAQLAQALDWTASGMDFADAPHLTATTDRAVFLSFDAKLAKAAAGRATTIVEAP